MNNYNKMNSNIKRNNLHEISEDYIDNMISTVKDMKAIIFDKETSIMFSLEKSKSGALKQEVFFFANIENIKPEDKFNLSGIFFLRPTEENLKYLKNVLSNLNFKDIHLCIILYIIVFSFLKSNYRGLFIKNCPI